MESLKVQEGDELERRKQARRKSISNMPQSKLEAQQQPVEMKMKIDNLDKL